MLLTALGSSAVVDKAADKAADEAAGAPGALDTPLTSEPGDAVRGRAIVANRQVGLCLLCHTGPIAEERFQGNLAPDLAGAGTRLSEGQLRLRLVDSQRVNPASIMPAYHRLGDRTADRADARTGEPGDGPGRRVGTAWQGRPVLAAQQVEDVVAYLRTLR